MASYVKSVGLLVIIVAVLCSPAHGSFIRNILKFLNKHDPPKTPRNNPRPPSGNVPTKTAQEFGLSLAQEFFDETIKDFRWGYNQGKLIQSSAQKCTKALNFTSCPQAPQPSPLSPESAPQPQPSPLSPEGAPQPQPGPFSPERAIYCIVEVTDSENGICVQQYESHTIPPEATCELDHPDELNATDCVQK